MFKKLALTLAIALSTTGTQTVSAQQQSQSTPPKTKPLQDKVTFNTKAIKLEKLKPGVPYAVNLCTGQEVPGAADLGSDTAQGLCGGPFDTKAITVTGGNPPYHFQLDTMGGFPPMGMHLGLNGLLYGTPAKPPPGGYKPFKVCAVDQSGTSGCNEMEFGKGGESTTHGIASHKGLIIGAAAGGAAVIGAAVALASGNSGSSGSSCSSLQNQCTSLVNQCLNQNISSACSQVNSAC